MRHGHQKMAGYGLQEGNCAVQTLDQRFIGDLGDTLLACPRCNLLQRIAAGAPGQHQPQEVGAGPHAARALERLVLARERLQVQVGREARQEGRKVVDRVWGCLRHLSYESYRFEPGQALILVPMGLCPDYLCDDQPGSTARAISCVPSVTALILSIIGLMSFQAAGRAALQGGYMMIATLAEKTCTPCRGGIPPLTPEEAEGYRAQAPEWALRDEATRIERTYRFRNFREAFAFVRRAAELAETEAHHPDISFGRGYATVSVRTKKIKGLHENGLLEIATFTNLVTCALRRHLGRRSPALEPVEDAAPGRMTVVFGERSEGYVERRLGDLARLLQQSRMIGATHFGWG